MQRKPDWLTTSLAIKCGIIFLLAGLHPVFDMLLGPTGQIENMGFWQWLGFIGYFLGTGYLCGLGIFILFGLIVTMATSLLPDRVSNWFFFPVQYLSDIKTENKYFCLSLVGLTTTYVVFAR
ncbi:MAG: hypothetical protein CBC23_008895 [Rhodospirillaceae bacterium TMED63]|nr:MAG: hypothetical protein CBC23_008895 [Rhodospirillaceae bacterium TMED63]|tara:strand:+ start:146 stop:511 length:366 start_codon:yes stop_codon:yes gene_type:complete